MSIIGYARVSTTDQDLELQERALRAAGCDLIRSEKRSGTTTAGREELKTVLDFLRAGDVLMVTRIDRLARSIGDLQDIVRAVKTRGASLKATEQPIDLRIPMKSPLRTEMISPRDSDMMSPPGPVPLAMGLLALSRLSSIVLLI